MMHIISEHASSVRKDLQPVVYKEGIHDYTRACHRPRVPLSASGDCQINLSPLDRIIRSPHDRREIYQHGAIGVVIETNHRSSRSHRTIPSSGGRGGCLPSDCQSVHSDENTPNLTGSSRSRVVILHQEELSRVPCDKNSNWPTERILSLPHITSTQRQPGAQISSVQSVKDEAAGLEEPEKNSAAGSTPLRLTPPTAPRPRRLPTPDLSEVCFLGEQIFCGCQSK